MLLTSIIHLEKISVELTTKKLFGFKHQRRRGPDASYRFALRRTNEELKEAIEDGLLGELSCSFFHCKMKKSIGLIFFPILGETLTSFKTFKKATSKRGQICPG